MPYEYKTEPYRHQREALNRSHDRDAFAYLMGPGAGKSKVNIDLSAFLFEEKAIDLVVILADNGIHDQWVTEQYPLHMPDRVPYRAASWRSGTANKAVAEVLQTTGRKAGRLGVVAVNTEGMSHAHIRARVKEMMDGRRVYFLCDESQRFKTPGTKRTRGVWDLAQAARYRRIATGSDITRGYEDLYGQFRILDWRIIGCRTFAEFKAQYVTMATSGDGREFIVGYRNVPELKERIKPHAFVCDTEDCVDMPPMVERVRHVELSDEQRRVYKELQQSYLAELDSGAVVDAQLAIVRLQRLQQITCGWVKDEQRNLYRFLDAPRVEVTVDLAAEARGKFIVWAEWQQDVERVSDALAKAKIKHALYYGGERCMGTGTLAANKEAFLRDKSVKGLVASYSKAARGHNFTNAHTVIDYSMTWDYEDWYQSRRRTHRIGQTAPCVYTTLYAPGTVDRRLKDSLTKKERMAQEFRDPKVFKQWLLGV